MPRFSPHSVAGHSVGPGLLYMFGQPSYPSVFRASEERPPFNSPHRWWEDDTATALWAFDIQEIRRVIRFGLISDEQLPRMALRSRSPPTVEEFLAGLVKPQERVFLANLSHNQMVEEIIRLSKPTTPPLVSWGWIPTCKDGDLDALTIAKVIDAESHLHFCRISFEELVRYALGYPTTRVEWFLQQHTCFFAHLLDHLHAFPEEMARYAEVESHLRGRSPFAHRAVTRALQAAGLQLDLPNPQPGFEFIVGPIQRLFRDPPSVKSILKVLCVLGIRFERTYLHSRDMNWSRPFSIAFSLFEDIERSSSSSLELARGLTSLDEQDFAALTEEGTFDKNIANRLSVRWELLSIDVWECCKALPDQLEVIQESLQHLLSFRNYHSLTAILSGLHKYSVSESTCVFTDNGNTALALNQTLPPEFLYLLEPFQNYAAYRQQYQQAAGIPFLIPHLNEYHQNGEPALQYLYGQLRSVIPPR
ncbi:hypothetical protein BDW62DRAFT_80010 [Aspergillus aurantiobrunneus]